MAITQYYQWQSHWIGWSQSKAFFVLQPRKACDKILVRHNSIGMTQSESVHFYIVKNAYLFQCVFWCVWSYVAVIGVVRFQVYDFSCVPFTCELMRGSE